MRLRKYACGPRSTRFWLPLILLAAALFRLTGVNWDQGQNLHPDERFLLLVASSEHWPEPAGLYFDEARSPLNPRNSGHPSFAYGTLPVTTLKAVSQLTGYADFHALTVLGRLLSALLDLLTVLLIFDFARALCLGRKTALYAAAFYAAAVCAIQHAHFFVVDPAANYFLAAALLSVALYRRFGRLRDAVAAGVCLGLALACKITAVVLLPVALLVFLDRARGSRKPGEAVWWRIGVLGRSACGFALFVAAALAVFRLAEPTAFRNPALWNLLPSERWLTDLAQSSRYASGAVDIPPGVQWAGRLRLWFPWSNLVVWGLGAALGLAAWAGWLAAARRIARGRGRYLLLPVAWVGLVFFYHGTQWAMTMRYFLPIYGSLCVLAAWALVRWGRLAGPRWRLLAPSVAASTFLWAAAFTTIYARPHTRVEASEWIYQHVAAGSSIGSEHWDDALPLRLPGRTPAAYRAVQLRWYDADTPGKLRQALDWLDASDYVVLSSNRLSGSIPRLPARYAMTARYYRALFDGTLGFERTAEFRTWMGEAGEEAFSVFDHPVVRIFRKTASYSRARAESVLGAVEWHNLVLLPAREAGSAPGGLMLPPERRRGQGAWTWNELFPAGSLAARFPLAVWMLAVVGLGWMAAPLLFVACPAFPDRGYGLAKTLGILLTGWLVWLAAGLGVGRFERPWIWACAAAIACVAAGLAWIRRREYAAFLRAHWRWMLAADLVFLAAFALMAGMRMGNPDLWHPVRGGEKPMDFAYLNAVLRSDQFPPQNPWFAGGFINYYYFGFVLVGTLLKGCGIPPESGYNLALATLFALAAAGLYSVTAALLPERARWKWAWLGPFFVLLLGNLKQAGVLVAGLGGAVLPQGEGYFAASRAIGVPPGGVPPITEFPFFTFLFGDLHAHVLALPLGVLALGLCVSLALPAVRTAWERRAALALAALACGAVWVTNPWDLPALALLLGAALWIGGGGGRAALEWTAVLAVAYLAFLPFHRDYARGYGEFDWWTGWRTTGGDYLVVYGVFLAAIVLGVAAPGRLRWRAVITALAATAAWLAAGAPGWVIPAALGALVFARDRAGTKAGRFTRLLVAAGLLLTFAVEFVVLHGDVGRMNTTFKFGFQAWLLLGLAGAVYAARWLDDAAFHKLRWPATAALAVLVAAALAYPLTAPYYRWRDRFAPASAPSWNGMAFLATARHSQCGQEFRLAGDGLAIDWLRANVRGTPVIAEANTYPILYGWGSRISVYTGLPAIVGWDWHLRQQMGVHDSGRVARRIADVQEIYDSPDPARAWELLRRYGAEYAVVGELERACSAAAGVAKFKAWEGRYWTLVFQSGDTRIYRLIH